MKTEATTIASRAIVCLEQAWAMLRDLEPELPPAVTIVVDAKSRRRTEGYFHHLAWYAQRKNSVHEIAVSPDFFGSPIELLAILLHEAAHAILHADEGGVTQYYHRKEFRDVCIRLGLMCSFHNTRYGWSRTGWPNESPVPKRYMNILRLFKSQLPRGTGKPILRRKQPEEGKIPKPGLKRLTCKCKTKRSIYANKTVSKKGRVLCQLCGALFQ